MAGDEQLVDSYIAVLFLATMSTSLLGRHT